MNNSRVLHVRPRWQRHVGDAWGRFCGEVRQHWRIYNQPHTVALQSSSGPQLCWDWLAFPGAVQQGSQTQDQQSSQHLSKTRARRPQRVKVLHQLEHMWAKKIELYDCCQFLVGWIISEWISVQKSNVPLFYITLSKSGSNSIITDKS